MISKIGNILKNLRVIQAVSQLITHFHFFLPQHLVTFFYDLGWYSLLMSLLCCFRRLFLRLYFNIISHNFLFFHCIYNFFCIWKGKENFKIQFVCLNFALQPFHHDLQTMLQMNQTLASGASGTNYLPFTLVNPLDRFLFCRWGKQRSLTDFLSSNSQDIPPS